ncbi:MAG: MopE-related protein, partial [Desulfococcaceae bacterium]
MSTGCSGGGDSIEPVVQEGVFADSLVEGLEYRTETQSGVTDAGGRFRYVEGETIEFFMGSIVIGRAVAGPVMTPVDLVEGAEDETDDEVTNIARFLQTVDDDGDPENGILITEEVRQAAATLSIDFSMTIVEFETDHAAVQAVSTLTTLTIAGPRALVSVAVAQFHLRITLQNLDDFTDDDGDGFSEEEGDCDDADPTVYPGAPEICGDGIDQDCDGVDLVCGDDDDGDDDADEDDDADDDGDDDDGDDDDGD